MELIRKIKFKLKKNKVVVVAGKGKKIVLLMLLEVLKNKKEKETFVFEWEEKRIPEFEFYLKNSSLPILVVTHFGEIPFDRDYFGAEKEEVEPVLEFAKKLPPFVKLVLNYDDETVREIDDFTNLHSLTFGFSERADIFVSDIKLNRGTNFKVNFKGGFVPFWLENTFGKEQIYGALAVCAIGKFLKMNLVEISQLIKSYTPPPGKMRLIEGREGSFILDDSESATVFSMIEAIEILGKIDWAKRKIAVLGDVTGIEKYTIEAHETIGERVAKNADFLFTFGKKARFIAKGAFKKGMKGERIFSFETIEEGIEKLKEKIKTGDIVLVDGSKEMEMRRIVDEIRKIW